MIPKIIHYVWVGGNPKSKTIQTCLASWRKRLPDYEIIEWNEDKLDLNANKYVKQAYQAKKWAFVSDYVRAKALYEMGGIYLDTDVMVLKDFTDLLNDRAFIGFENNDYLSAAIIAAEKGHPFMADILHYYDDLDFAFDQKDQLAGVNSLSVTEILKEKYGLKTGNQEQVLKEGIHVYPDGILCNPSPQSRSIHLFTGTWLEGKNSWKHDLVTFLKLHIRSQKAAKIYYQLFRR